MLYAFAAFFALAAVVSAIAAMRNSHSSPTPLLVVSAGCSVLCLSFLAAWATTL